jgi:hypothetical protein
MWDEHPGHRDAMRSRISGLRTQSRATCERCRAVLEWIEHNSAAPYPATG